MSYSRDVIDNDINEFLEERRESAGGWAPVAKEDMEQLHTIIDRLISAKWEKDPDGDLPVEFLLINRTRYQSSSYRPIPNWYYLKPHSKEEEDIMTILHYNLAVAYHELEAFMKSRAFRLAGNRT